MVTGAYFIGTPSYTERNLMRAMTLADAGKELILRDIPMPKPRSQDVLLQILACGVCRTDLHIIDHELPPKKTCIVPGHEVVGRVSQIGNKVTRFRVGDRVGVPWLGSVCGHCAFCQQREENLCDSPGFTGYDRNGGFAQYMVADARFCFALPEYYDDVHAAPLLCAGLIGYRAYKMTGISHPSAPARIGIYGFGAAAHIICQIAVSQGKNVYAFVRPGDEQSQVFARELGAKWAGAATDRPDVLLDAAIIFAPAGELVPIALAAVRKGGTVVCAGIHMSDIPAFPYSLLWGERSIRSVANLTRNDGEEFFALLQKNPVRTHVHTFSLENANLAIATIRSGKIDGAAVLVP